MIRFRLATVPVLGVLVAVLLGFPGSAGGITTGASHPGAAASARSGADRRIATAWMTIPAIGIRHLRVIPYRGTPDDWPGTRIQDRGLAAAPYGNRGGVGPGDVGNYLVTGHRLSAGGPFRAVPRLQAGEKVYVTSGGTTYTYTITDTRKVDFRSPRSLAEQRAAVPGFPGRKPTKAMITVSTCATLEDNAAGNFWRDAKDNPQHRIDKVGVLTSRSKASGRS